tara:strand:+ start:68 stop:493 length:426 start_codon:yes stop_codon:yes gene_type:complete
MKKFSLLILSVLLLSCSSDDEDAKEGNFLEVYNGVIWKTTDSNVLGGLEWFVFTPQGFNSYIIENGCEESTGYIWGVANLEDGSIVTVLENSKDFLKIGSGSSSEFSTFTVVENGNVLSTSNVLIGSKLQTNWSKVSELCK